MRLSLVLPVRNGGPHLAPALAAIAAQTRPPDEVVIVLDPRSTDDSAATIAAWGRATVVLEQAGTGVADAINLGWATATGDLLALTSHDDLLEPDAFARHLAALERTGADLSVGAVEWFVDAAGPPAGFRPELVGARRVARMIETAVVRRELVERIGGHRPEMGASSDVDWFARAHDAGATVVEIPELVVRKRLHAASTAHTEDQRGLLLALRRSAERKRLPSASVVIPVRDVVEHLAAAVESALRQDPAPLEVIVVDDGSADPEAVTTALGSRAVQVVRQAAAGPGAARNRGAARARGEVVVFLDGDDLMEPLRLQHQLTALAANPGLAAVGGLTQPAGADGVALDQDATPGLVPSALALRRSAFLDTGGFDETLVAGELIEWVARAREVGLEIEVVPEVVTLRRRHDHNLTLDQDRVREGYLQAVKATLDRRRREAP